MSDATISAEGNRSASRIPSPMAIPFGMTTPAINRRAMPPHSRVCSQSSPPKPIHAIVPALFDHALDQSPNPAHAGPSPEGARTSPDGRSLRQLDDCAGASPTARGARALRRCGAHHRRRAETGGERPYQGRTSSPALGCQPRVRRPNPGEDPNRLGDLIGCETSWAGCALPTRVAEERWQHRGRAWNSAREQNSGHEW
jgi:hypothetical protein